MVNILKQKEQLIIKFVTSFQGGIGGMIEKNTRKVQEIVFRHGPDWQYENGRLVKDWKKKRNLA